MTVTATPYGQSFKGLGLGRFDFSTHTFKLMLTTSSYTPGFDTHEFKSDVTSEIAGSGYVAGGQALTGLAWTYDATNDRCVLTCDPVAWPGATFTTRYGVIYRDTGTAATSPLLFWVDFGVNASPASVAFTVTFSSGAYRIRVP